MLFAQLGSIVGPSVNLIWPNSLPNLEIDRNNNHQDSFQVLLSSTEKRSTKIKRIQTKNGNGNWAFRKENLGCELGQRFLVTVAAVDFLVGQRIGPNYLKKILQPKSWPNYQFSIYSFFLLTSNTVLIYDYINSLTKY